LPEHVGATEEFRAGLAEAKGYSDAIAQSLPQKIGAASLTFKSKLPFKALSLREILIHRVSALSTAAIEMFERERLIPAMVLTRAVVETVAVTFNLHRKLMEFHETKDTNVVDDFLVRGLVGQRQPDALVQSTNVLTLIDHVEKTVTGFRRAYDILSECAHPNWAGTLGAYGKIDHENLELQLGPSDRTTGLTTGVFTLSTSLMLFQHFYNDMIEPLKEFNEHFEQGASTE
jgi:hypothetical protein